MVHYRRNRLPGASYFFTVTLRDRQSDMLLRHVDALRTAFRCVREERPFNVDAVVVLPDHLHTVWTLPPADSDYPGRWQRIKSRFTTAVREVHRYVERGLYPRDWGSLPDRICEQESDERMQCTGLAPGVDGVASASPRMKSGDTRPICSWPRP